MRMSLSSRTHGDVRTVTVTLTGDDAAFIALVDEGNNLHGDLGNLTAAIAARTGLVDERADRHANAARLLRRAAELLLTSDANL